MLEYGTHEPRAIRVWYSPDDAIGTFADNILDVILVGNVERDLSRSPLRRCLRLNHGGNDFSGSYIFCLTLYRNGQLDGSLWFFSKVCVCMCRYMKNDGRWNREKYGSKELKRKEKREGRSCVVG